MKLIVKNKKNPRDGTTIRVSTIGKKLDNWHRNSANEGKMHNRTKKRKPEVVISTSWNHMTGNYKKNESVTKNQLNSEKNTVHERKCARDMQKCVTN